MQAPNIAIAGFHHETNTFAPQPTPYEEFVKDDGWPGLVTNEEVIAALEPLNLGMGGFIQAAHQHQWQLAPILWCNAEPYAHVTEDAYERIVGSIVGKLAALLESTAPPDGLYLCLHGAMVAQHIDDGEGELLSRIRQLTGASLPIVISLDLHANISPRMFELSDAMAIFRTYPHIDMADTGRRAFNLLHQMIETGTKPAKAFRQGDFLLPLTAQYTGAAPTNNIYAQVEDLSAVAGVSCDFACGFPPSDIPHCGPSAVAYAADEKQAQQIVDSLMQTVSRLESEFAARLMDAKDAVETASQLAAEQQKKSHPKPVVIADVQDNPGAGGSGDTTGLLYAMLQQGLTNACLAAIWDPVTAQQATDAGISQVIECSIGGKSATEGVRPWQGNAEVVALSDGNFYGVGPMMKGTQYKLGPMALLRITTDKADVQVVIASERGQCLDRGFLLTLNIDPPEMSVIAVKSSVHFRNDFENLASHILLAACPGANPCDLSAIPYTRLRSSVRLPRSN